MIELHQYEQIHHWKPEEIKLIKAVASRLGIAIAQANLLTENKQQLEKLNKQNIQLQEKTKQAEAANKAKTNFLANMSHEIRTPLNAILGFSDLLSKKITDPEKVNYVESIIFSGNNLLQLVNDIFELIKLDSGKIELQYEAVHLPEIMRQLDYNFSKKVYNKNIKLVFDINDNIPDMLEVDKLKLYQILNKLIKNAIKFTELGSVTINVWSDHFQSDLKTHQENCSLTITIEDMGIGISQEKQEMIFDTFTQVSQEINRKYEGIGLGLTLNHKLIQLLGGSIQLESQLEKGTAITVTFANLKIIRFSNQKALNLITEKQLTNKEATNSEQGDKISFEQLLELLEKLYDYQENSLQKLQQTLSTKEIKTFITLLLDWGQTYQSSELLNYAKEMSQALEELDLENLSQLIENFPELRNTLLNKF